MFTQEAFRHHKTIALVGQARADELGLTGAEPGVTDAPDAFFEALSLHRHWDR